MAKNHWNVQDAKNKFDILIKQVKKSPQFITKSGKNAVVVLSIEDYEKLIDSKSNLVEFLQNSPLRNSGIELERGKDTTQRDFEL